MDSRSFVASYADTWHDWFADLSDIVSVELSAGEGIGAAVQPTKLFQAGVMFEDVMKVGLRNRGFGFYKERRKEGGLSWFYYRDLTYEPIVGTPGLFEREPLMQDFTIRHNNDRHWMDIGAEAHVIFGGASAYVSPKETLDFLGNTLTLPYNLLFRPILCHIGFHPPEFDLSNDDVGSRARNRQGLELINSPSGFEPAEVLDRLMRVP